MLHLLSEKRVELLVIQWQLEDSPWKDRQLALQSCVVRSSGQWKNCDLR